MLPRCDRQGDLLSSASDARLADVRLPRRRVPAIAAHALVDSFLTFTPTYVAFAIAAGLPIQRRHHAHRV